MFLNGDNKPVQAPRIPRCFQQTHLVRFLSVLENLQLARELSDSERTDGDAQIEQLLGAVGLAHLGDRSPDSLSGGELARIGIVRALATDPAVLLVDEPTASLDRGSADGVVELLGRIARDHDQLVLVATHDPLVMAVATERIELKRAVE